MSIKLFTKSAIVSVILSSSALANNIELTSDTDLGNAPVLRFPSGFGNFNSQITGTGTGTGVEGGPEGSSGTGQPSQPLENCLGIALTTDEEADYNYLYGKLDFYTRVDPYDPSAPPSDPTPLLNNLQNGLDGTDLFVGNNVVDSDSLPFPCDVSNISFPSITIKNETTTTGPVPPTPFMQITNLNFLSGITTVADEVYIYEASANGTIDGFASPEAGSPAPIDASALNSIESINGTGLSVYYSWLTGLSFNNLSHLEGELVFRDFKGNIPSFSSLTTSSLSHINFVSIDSGFSTLNALGGSTGNIYISDINGSINALNNIDSVAEIIIFDIVGNVDVLNSVSGNVPYIFINNISGNINGMNNITGSNSVYINNISGDINILNGITGYIPTIEIYDISGSVNMFNSLETIDIAEITSVSSNSPIVAFNSLIYLGDAYLEEVVTPELNAFNNITSMDYFDILTGSDIGDLRVANSATFIDSIYIESSTLGASGISNSFASLENFYAISLSNLIVSGGSITGPTSFTNLSGFEIDFFNNSNLSTISGFSLASPETTSGGQITFSDNSLTSISGFDNFLSLDYLKINEANLTSFTALSGIESLGMLTITDSPRSNLLPQFLTTINNLDVLRIGTQGSAAPTPLDDMTILSSYSGSMDIKFVFDYVSIPIQQMPGQQMPGDEPTDFNAIANMTNKSASSSPFCQGILAGNITVSVDRNDGRLNSTPVYTFTPAESLANLCE